MYFFNKSLRDHRSLAYSTYFACNVSMFLNAYGWARQQRKAGSNASHFHSILHFASVIVVWDVGLKPQRPDSICKLILRVSLFKLSSTPQRFTMWATSHGVFAEVEELMYRLHELRQRQRRKSRELMKTYSQPAYGNCGLQFESAHSAVSWVPRPHLIWRTTSFRRARVSLIPDPTVSYDNPYISRRTTEWESVDECWLGQNLWSRSR